MEAKDNVLVWLDLEMTGLDPETCAIVQLGMVLTNSQLEELAPPLEITIWQPDSVLETMSPFVRNMHQRSGLLDKIRASTVSVDEAERKVLELLTQHAPYRSGILAGNSVWQDRRFIARYMPALEGYLHYRQVDVSSIKELARSWYNETYDKPEDGQHTALFDVQQSIAELRFYREKVFRKE